MSPPHMKADVNSQGDSRSRRSRNQSTAIGIAESSVDMASATKNTRVASAPRLPTAAQMTKDARSSSTARQTAVVLATLGRRSGDEIASPVGSRRNELMCAASLDAQPNSTAARPASTMPAAPIRIGRRSPGAPSPTTIIALTTVLVSAAMTMAVTATAASPLRAYSDIDSVIASTSVVPASAATTYTPSGGKFCCTNATSNSTSAKSAANLAAEVRLNGLLSGTPLPADPLSAARRYITQARPAVTAAIARKGTTRRGSSAWLTINTVASTRRNMTPQAIRMPQAKAGAERA